MAQKATSKGSLLFIFITVLIDIMGIAIIIPVFPDLIEALTGQQTSEASLDGGLLIASFAIMQFLFSPLLGELSDRFGRRPVLFIALAGLGVDYLFQAFAPTLALLFVGRMLAGVCGASHTVAAAYIADVSTPQNKAKNFGLLGAAFGLGFFLGPMIGGVCAQWGYQVPFIAAAIMTFLNLIFGLIVLPESLKPENRRPINWRNVIPGVSLKHLSKYKSLGLLILAFILVQLSGRVMESIWTFFTKTAFEWSPAAIGVSLGVVGLLVGIVQAVVVGKVVKRFGKKKAILAGFVLSTVGLFGISVAFSETILYIALIPYILGGIAGPTMQGLMSNSVKENEQGNLQGALTSMISLTAVLGPLIYTTLFFTFSADDAPVKFYGAPYVASAVIMILASVIVYIALKRLPDDGEDEDSSDSTEVEMAVTTD
ncbi:MAG: tetracycline resistance MFS efflux pump [Crocinitomix sp. MedPE-SWsnd]|jgi:MFS transporter, DHA1 family, tetracycline resistance protein|nr:MAG: tetracycline resistance MFS efflux pump [Crocinitomix sp. MedPE-SWsnd]